MTSIEIHDLVRTLEGRGVTLEPKANGGVRLNAPRPLEPELLEVIKANKTALFEVLTSEKTVKLNIVVTPNPSRLTQTSINALFEPSPFSAMLEGLPAALEVIQECGDRAAWLQAKTPGGEWSNSVVVEPTSLTLSMALNSLNARCPDAVVVTLHSAAIAPHADVHPARGYPSLRARFSRKEVSA